MESFAADWLALREPADHAARAEAVTAALAVRLRGGHRGPAASKAWAGSGAGGGPGLDLAPRGATSGRAVDLAAGTGSNVRYLLPRLPSITHWTLVDHDDALLAVARASLEPLAREAGVTIETVVGDLRDVEALPIDGCALVTASALLDLVSASWLAALASRCDSAGTAVLFALSYDGRLDAEPPDPLDARVRELVNAHQRTDKGFGPALGPDATLASTTLFAAREIVTSASDWRLDGGDGELQHRLLVGWAAAARDVAPAEASAIDGWLERRLGLVAAGRSRIRVGHQDFGAW